jgi:hypothetical protein
VTRRDLRIHVVAGLKTLALAFALFTAAAMIGKCTARAQTLNVVPQGNRTFNMTSICPGYTLSTNRGKAEVYLRCPPATDPWIVIKDCVDPKVVRNGPYVNITCTKPVKT